MFRYLMPFSFHLLNVSCMKVLTQLTSFHLFFVQYVMSRRFKDVDEVTGESLVAETVDKEDTATAAPVEESKDGSDEKME